MHVSEFMTRNPVGIQVDQPAEEAARLMRDTNVGALLVYDVGNLAGIVTDRDLTVRCLASPEQSNPGNVGQFMTPDPIAVDADTPADEALRVMSEHKIRRLAVKEGDQITGIVSLDDLGGLLDLFSHTIGSWRMAQAA